MHKTHEENVVWEKMLHRARMFVRKEVKYSFNNWETVVLLRFFSNTDKKIFFIRVLPSAVSATLMSMYSRIKNPRGLRGHFVDSLLVLMLANFMKQFENVGDNIAPIEKFVKENTIINLEAFIKFSEETKGIYENFLACTNIDPKYMNTIAASQKIKKFLTLFLDKYGHNSIARVGFEMIGAEGISILAAKSFEWTRPAAGYIELSTRFVDMSSKDLYPFWNEFACINPMIAMRAHKETEEAFQTYCNMMEDSVFDEFLRKVSKNKISQDELLVAIKGEVCDVLGNFLPCATLTSLGMSISGESFPMLIKHLRLDGTPENYAIAECLEEEAQKTGSVQFLRHTELTSSDVLGWEYMRTSAFQRLADYGQEAVELIAPSAKQASVILGRIFSNYEDSSLQFQQKFLVVNRGEYDKLPPHYEALTLTIDGVMSFRGWRDLHRQSFCAHMRTYVNPILGFYRYDKQAPAEYKNAAKEIHEKNLSLYRAMENNGNFSKEMMQYPMAMGNLIGYTMIGNWRQIEFCIWQRTKFSVNHEVRRVFLNIHEKLNRAYPQWFGLCRVDNVHTYLFARTKIGITSM